MLFWFVALAFVQAFVHPIEVRNAHFVDSVTQEPFLIKGVDYQPGGSSGYLEWSDPLSDVESCARDIFLFQKLGINTIRVYTVNPNLNHDACMTMLAAAGIYLVLDVNSPKIGESLNRYEPWTTYNPDYLHRIFQVVEQFSYYNNTLGFFMGNEIVNDERSASVAPAYIRAVTRDLKNYILYNSPRSIPVGYSAADDLRYRIPLADYLTCGDEESAVDFYGVNSYQWCGQQTFQTSGYDLLVRDHEKFTVPFFLSEFGCNLVRPRLFQEVEMLFSPAMTHVFSGGLVYEFTQEPNDYGLVELDINGNAHIKHDFDALRLKFENVTADHTTIPVMSQPRPRQNCKTYYPGLSPNIEEPPSFGTEMIRNGVRIKRGQLLPNMELLETHMCIYDAEGVEITDKKIVVTVPLSDPALLETIPLETLLVSSSSSTESSASVTSLKSIVSSIVSSTLAPSTPPPPPTATIPADLGLTNRLREANPRWFRGGNYIKAPQYETETKSQIKKYESAAGSPLGQSLWVIALSFLVCFLLALNYQ